MKHPDYYTIDKVLKRKENSNIALTKAMRIFVDFPTGKNKCGDFFSCLVRDN